MKYFYSYSTPVREITILTENEFITRISFKRCVFDDATESETPLHRHAITQLREYFSGKRTVFGLPVNPAGTDFQKKVWEALQTIPYGETRSYKQIAAMVGNDKASRAVGLANNKNPIPIIIPCHRVIGTNGKLTGYAGGLDIKEVLLHTESLSLF